MFTNYSVICTRIISNDAFPLFDHFNRALYLAKNGAELARTTFKEHRAFYHPIAATMIAKDLGLAK